jgi:hypothetical protein
LSSGHEASDRHFRPVRLCIRSDSPNSKHALFLSDFCHAYCT